MRMSNLTKVCVSFVMAFFMTPIPSVALAETQMIATSVVVTELTRAQTEQKIQSFLQRQDVQKELTKQGVSSAEVSKRLASLSDNELRQLSGQMDQARYGGDILIAILIVVLIIFLIKRI